MISKIAPAAFACLFVTAPLLSASYAASSSHSSTSTHSTSSASSHRGTTASAPASTRHGGSPATAQPNAAGQFLTLEQGFIPTNPVLQQQFINASPQMFAKRCEGSTSVNCEARDVSEFDAAHGDPAGIPRPTTAAPGLPTAAGTPGTPGMSPTVAAPAPPADPQPDLSPLPFEQSGGTAHQSDPGGGQPTLSNCMSLWEEAVHMTKTEWKAVCIRTLNGINEPSIGLGLDPAVVTGPATATGSASLHRHNKIYGGE